VDVAHLLIAQLAVAQAADGVILIQALLRLGGRFDVPLQQRQPQGFRHLLGQHGLARAGLALDQQWPLQLERGVDSEFQVVGGDVLIGTLEFHAQAQPGCYCVPV
jgi:hypothetical protein